MMQNYETENAQMRYLSAIGMILIVSGHLQLNVFDVGGLFPYYSFHVFLFLFIAGYFYKESAEEKIGAFLLKKAKTLLLPYFIWNLFYGIFSTIMNARGIALGGKLSLYNLFAAPFLGGHQFMYNFPAWFVPALFLTETVYVLGRKLVSLLLGMFLKTDKKAVVIEWVVFAGTLLAGILTVYLAAGGHVWGYYKDIGRILFMLPGLSFGRMYRFLRLEKLRKDSILFHFGYLAAVLLIQLIIRLFYDGLAFSTVWVTSFANGPVIPFLTILTGIAFWLEIAYLAKKAEMYVRSILADPDRHTKKTLFCAKQFRAVLCSVKQTGRESFSVMMHHMMILFLINSLVLCLNRRYGFCPSFDTGQYLSEVNYVAPFAGERLTKWIDLFLCIGIPVTLSMFAKKGFERLTAAKTKNPGTL